MLGDYKLLKVVTLFRSLFIFRAETAFLLSYYLSSFKISVLLELSLEIWLRPLMEVYYFLAIAYSVFSTGFGPTGLRYSSVINLSCFCLAITAGDL